MDNMTPFVLMIALSVHSIFEGLATGISKDMKDVINMIIAIVLHKGAAGTSLGISLVKTFPNEFKLVRTLVLIFSIATPLGVILGMILADADDIYEIIFNSIAAGTFFYIACSEIIVEEFALEGYRFTKMIFFLLGATMITCLYFIE